MDAPNCVKTINLSEELDPKEGQFGLDNFISLDEKYQDDLLRVLDLVRSYIIEPNPTRPLNFYVEASPGSGKSFLIKCMIAAAKFKNGRHELEFIPFNLSQVKGPEEFLDLFEKVRNQNVNKNKLPVVFFDEVDSLIGNVHAYRHFLTPMYDGVVYRNGMENPIGRAIFFFAASAQLIDLFRKNIEKDTRKPAWLNRYFKRMKDGQPQDYGEWVVDQKELRENILNSWHTNPPKDLPEKIRDFLDRIDEFIYIPPSYLRVNQSIKKQPGCKADTFKQSALLIAALLRKYKPSLTGISILACYCLIESLMSNKSRRTTESYIFNSMTPHDGFLKVAHLPPDCAKKYKNKAENKMEKGMEKGAFDLCKSEVPVAFYRLKKIGSSLSGTFSSTIHG